MNSSHSAAPNAQQTIAPPQMASIFPGWVKKWTEAHASSTPDFLEHAIKELWYPTGKPHALTFRWVRELLTAIHYPHHENVQTAARSILDEVPLNLHTAVASLLVLIAIRIPPPSEVLYLYPQQESNIFGSAADRGSATKLYTGKLPRAAMRLNIIYVVQHILALQIDDPRDGPAVLNQVDEHLIPVLPLLVSLTAYRSRSQSLDDRLYGLLESWKKNESIVSIEKIDHDKMRRRIIEAKNTRLNWLDFSIKIAQEADEIAQDRMHSQSKEWSPVPLRHGVIGDSEAPWHELPATNGLYMKRTRGYPMKSYAFPMGGYEVPGAGFQPDPELKQEVDDLKKELYRAFEKDTNSDEVQDVDALGNIIWKDPNRPTRNYWGYTLDGIERMNEVRKWFVNQPKQGYDDIQKPIQPPSLPTGFRQQQQLEPPQLMQPSRGGAFRGVYRGGRGNSGGYHMYGGWRGGRKW